MLSDNRLLLTLLLPFAIATGRAAPLPKSDEGLSGSDLTPILSGASGVVSGVFGKTLSSYQRWTKSDKFKCLKYWLDLRSLIDRRALHLLRRPPSSISLSDELIDMICARRSLAVQARNVWEKEGRLPVANDSKSSLSSSSAPTPGTDASRVAPPSKGQAFAPKEQSGANLLGGIKGSLSKPATAVGVAAAATLPFLGNVANAVGNTINGVGGIARPVLRMSSW